MKKVFIFTLAWVGLQLACDDRYNKVPPEDAAQKFVNDLNIKIQGKPTCTGKDTDDDGYVTCTVALATPTPDGKLTMSLQCAGVTGDGCDSQTNKYTTGCKETVPKVQVKSGS
jgi:hypothetical protein